MDLYEKIFRTKQSHFRSIFKSADGQLNESGKVALAHLRVFCHVTKSAPHGDTERIEGRREAFWEIMNFLNVPYEELYALNDYTGEDEFDL